MPEVMKNTSLLSGWRSFISQPLVIGAVLIRLLLMPFFAHEDLFSTYRRALEIALGERSLFSLTSIVPHFIEAVTLKIYAVFTGLNYFTTIFRPLTDIPNVNALAFLFKLPYLIAEIAAWWLFFRAFSPRKNLRLWILFNPVVLYSIYIFGRFESFVLVLLTLTLIWLSQRELLKTAGGFVLMLATRASLALIAPAFVFLRLPIRTKFLTLGGIFLSVIGLLLVLPKQVTLGFLTWILAGQHTGYLLEAQISLGWNFRLYLLPVGMTIALLALWKTLSLPQAKKFSHSDIFALTATVILFLYYALAITHPQYYVWVLPVWWYVLHRFHSPTLWMINLLFVIGFFLTLPAWEGKTTVGTLFPIADFFWLIDMTGELWLRIAGLGKSLLAGTFLWGIYELLQLPKRRSSV